MTFSFIFFLLTEAANGRPATTYIYGTIILYIKTVKKVFGNRNQNESFSNGRAAGNLNQIAKNLNSGVSVDEGILQAIRTAISEMTAFNRKLEKMYREHYGNSKTHFEQEC